MAKDKAAANKQDESKNRIPVAELLAALRHELLEARSRGEGSEIRFVVEEAEVELEVGVTKAVEGGGGVQFWVYTAEGKFNAGEHATQKITLKLKPVDSRTGQPIKTSGTDPLPKS